MGRRVKLRDTAAASHHDARQTQSHHDAGCQNQGGGVILRAGLGLKIGEGDDARAEAPEIIFYLAVRDLPCN